MYNLTDHIARRQLVARLQEEIDAFCRAEFEEDPRKHLGASIIGHECTAYGWNTFRWLKFEEFDGRMLRLFNRGHEEERRFVRWLQGVGLQVRELDPVTKKQFRIVGAKGHFGGSLDSLMKFPLAWGLPEDLVILGEFKTHNTKSFKALKAKGVVASKPQHFKQMNSYGRAYGLKYGLYCAVCKDTDELHFEIIELDYRQADDLFRKAEGIVYASERPQKIAQTKTYITCSYCPFKGLCHENEVPVKNCRSCRHAVAVDGAEWFCELYSPVNGNLPAEVIAVGCGSWARIA